MAAEWYVCLNGDQKGPLSTSELRRWLREGRITRDTFVKQGPASPWAPLRECVPPSSGDLARGIVTFVAVLAAAAIAVEVALLLFADPAAAKVALVAGGLAAAAWLLRRPLLMRKGPAG